jgi:hypothetical protein
LASDDVIVAAKKTPPTNANIMKWLAADETSICPKEKKAAKAAFPFNQLQGRMLEANKSGEKVRLLPLEFQWREALMLRVF